MAALVARDPRFVLARRVITRPGDAGGEDFEGVDDADFDRRAQRGDFALHWEAHGLRYGIPAHVDADLFGGQDVLANLSRAVMAQAKARFGRFEVIALDADRAVLAARLAGRARESADQIARRLDRAVPAMPEDVQVHQIENSGPLDRTVTAILARLYPVSV